MSQVNVECHSCFVFRKPRAQIQRPAIVTEDSRGHSQTLGQRSQTNRKALSFKLLQSKLFSEFQHSGPN